MKGSSAQFAIFVHPSIQLCDVVTLPREQKAACSCPDCPYPTEPFTIFWASVDRQILQIHRSTDLAAYRS